MQSVSSEDEIIVPNFKIPEKPRKSRDRKKPTENHNRSRSHSRSRSRSDTPNSQNLRRSARIINLEATKSEEKKYKNNRK